MQQSDDTSSATMASTAYTYLDAHLSRSFKLDGTAANRAHSLADELNIHLSGILLELSKNLQRFKQCRRDGEGITEVADSQDRTQKDVGVQNKRERAEQGRGREERGNKKERTYWTRENGDT